MHSGLSLARAVQLAWDAEASIKAWKDIMLPTPVASLNPAKRLKVHSREGAHRCIQYLWKGLQDTLGQAQCGIHRHDIYVLDQLDAQLTPLELHPEEQKPISVRWCWYTVRHPGVAQVTAGSQTYDSCLA